MKSLVVRAQSLSPVESNAIGGSITSLIGSMGAAGAAVAVTYYFLNFLRDHGEKQDRLFDEFKNFHAESQRKFQDQLDKLSDRQETLQRSYQEQVGRITEGQNLLLRDAIQAMKSVEKTLDNSTSIIHGIEKTVGSLQTALVAIDTHVRRPVDYRPSFRPGPYAPVEETSP